MSSSGQGGSGGGTGKVLKRANPQTIHDKFLVGYQGWFTCAGDGEPIAPGHHGWMHWFNSPITHGGHPNIDLWPDVSSYSQSELFPAPGLKYTNGDQVHLFSSRNSQTVKRHFHWMAEHGVDGAFLQRFAAQCDIENGNEGVLRLRDEVGDRVKEAAEAEGRVFAIMYDVSNVPANRIQMLLERDWGHLLHHKRVLDSPAYLREKGKPVVALWGFGFENAGHTPELVRAIASYFRQATPGGVYLMAGAPAHWRTAEKDADRNPGFLDVWLNDFDAISPWTVGRYRNERDADDFAERQIRGDSDLIKRRNEEGTWRRVDYIPVVLPGTSGLNLSQGRWAFNDAPRQGGRFLWKQIFNAKRFGARTIYGAMWDEYDEGTAFMPAIEKKRLLPASDQYQFLALDQDGHDVPSDWYMRICGFAAEGLRSERRIHETFPSKELQDYWATRPRFEDVPEGVTVASSAGASGAVAAGSGSGPAGGQSYEDWLNAQKEEKEEAPPPPYSLEAAEGASTDQPEEVAPTTAPTVTTNVQPTVQAAPAPTVAPAAGASSASVLAAAVSNPSPAQFNQPAQPAGPPPVNVGSRPADAGGQFSPTSGGQFSPTSGGQFSPTSGGQFSPTSGSHPIPNMQTHPQPGPTQTPHPHRHDSVASITSEFGRQSISGTQIVSTQPPHPQRHDSVASYTSEYGRQNTSGTQSPANTMTPPLHPARPGGRPPTAQGRPDQPLQGHHPSISGPHGQSRPGSQAGYTQPTVPLPSQTPPQASQSPVWPPPEWGSGRPPAPPQHPSQSGQAGAKLSRPHTFTASSYSSSSSYRPPTAPPQRPPHVTASPQHTTPPLPQGPPSPQQGGMFPAPGGSFSPSGMSFPVAGQGSGYQPGYSSYNAGGSSAYPSAGGYNQPTLSSQDPPISIPSAYGAPSASAYPPAGQGYPGYSAGPSTYPQLDYSGGSGAPYHAGSSYGMPYAPGPSHSDSVHFPQVHAGQSQSIGLPQASTTGSGYYNPQAGNYEPSQQAGPSAWVPGASMNTTPPLPPRPAGNYSQYSTSSSSSSSGTSFPLANSAAVGMALNAVDKFAGKKARQQLESGVGSLASTGSKLLGKFTK